MKFGVLGTGVVGRTIGSKLVELGHEVRMGSRQAGGSAATTWVTNAGPLASEGTFASAAEHGEIVFNATAGTGSLSALRAAGGDNLAGKITIDLSNPLEFSPDAPPRLSVMNTDSLGEQIQRAFPDTFVVKTLNTVNAEIMVSPGAISSPHSVFVAGNDSASKMQVGQILQSFGWKPEAIIDLGDITGSRGMEAFLLLWLRLFQATGSPRFNVAVVKP